MVAVMTTSLITISPLPRHRTRRQGRWSRLSGTSTRHPVTSARDRDAAHTVALHPEQGWSLLCNGVIVFDDMGEILPGGRVIPPHVRLPVAA